MNLGPIIIFSSNFRAFTVIRINCLSGTMKTSVECASDW